MLKDLRKRMNDLSENLERVKIKKDIKPIKKQS